MVGDLANVRILLWLGLRPGLGLVRCWGQCMVRVIVSKKNYKLRSLINVIVMLSYKVDRSSLSIFTMITEAFVYA